MAKAKARRNGKAAARKKPSLMPQAEAKWAPINRWCEISGMGRTSTYQRIAAGHLRAIKLGTRLLIDVDHGLKFMARQPAATIVLPHSRTMPDAPTP
jgi:hypothetical protein